MEGPDNQELKDTAEQRALRRNLAHLECCLACLRKADAHHYQITSDREENIAKALNEGYSRLDALQLKLGGRICSRHRPKQRDGARSVRIYLDESGDHRFRLSATDLDSFALGAVVIDETQEDAVQAAWDQWKMGVWGTTKKVIHAVKIRHCSGPFYFDGDKEEAAEVAASICPLLKRLDFRCSVVVFRNAEYLKIYGNDRVDASLPYHIYHMALDFLMERLVMALDQEDKGAHGHLVAESRGAKEDAELQHEFARLHLDGTSYVSDSWFRAQLRPDVSFKTKQHFLAGLEIADLLVSACAEKVMNPASTPLWWPEFRAKLYQSKLTDHSPLGIKIMPWDDQYEDFWES